MGNYPELHVRTTAGLGAVDMPWMNEAMKTVPTERYMVERMIASTCGLSSHGLGADIHLITS
jgi:hypothetical protein